MPILKLTQLAVDKGCKAPERGRIEYWDTQLPGFGLRVAAHRPGRKDGAARRSWQVMYRVGGRKVRETLGSVATIPKVEDARALARESMATADRGVHPVQERRRVGEEKRREAEASERDTLGAVIDRYLQRYARPRMRPNYFAETKRSLTVDVKPTLGGRPIGDITRRDVRELLDAIVDRGSPSHANHVLAYTRAMLNWAVSNDLIGTNPVMGLKAPAPNVQRDRTLDDGEIRAFWLSCDQLGWPFGPLFKLLLLTALRRDEVAEANWSEVDLAKGLWTLPGKRTKNGKAHVVHLAPAAVEILARLPRIGSLGLLFTTNGDRPVSGFGRARERLTAKMTEARDNSPIEGSKLAPFTLHDLRRTAATGMAAIGIAHHVVDRILNHAEGKISGIAAIYNRHAYLNERKTALERWAGHVLDLSNPGSASLNVVQLVV